MLDGSGKRLSLDAKALNNQPSRIINVFVGVVFVLIVVVLGLIAWSLLQDEALPRTSAERDLIRYENLVKKNPKDAMSQAGLGVSYMQVGEYRKAAVHLKKAVKLQPENAIFYIKLADAHYGEGDVQSALRVLGKAQQLDGKTEEAWYQEGKILYDQGKYEKSIPFLKKSLEINSGAADTHFMLATAYEKTNEPDAALNHYREAVRFIPDYPEAIKAIQRLN